MAVLTVVQNGFDAPLTYLPPVPACQKYSLNIAEIKSVNQIQQLQSVMNAWTEMASHLCQENPDFKDRFDDSLRAANGFSNKLNNLHEHILVYAAFDNDRHLRSSVMFNKSSLIPRHFGYLYVIYLVSEPSLPKDHYSGGGTALLQQGEEQCVRWGRKGMCLYSYNLAKPFYLKYGFVQEPSDLNFMTLQRPFSKT